MKKAPRIQLAISGAGVHSDDKAVQAFALRMCAKLAQKRADGREGWEDCSAHQLAKMLVEHVAKGDPVDIANFCMFLASIGETNRVIRLELREALEEMATDGMAHTLLV